MMGALIGVALGLGAYWAAEQRGRAPQLWLLLTTLIVLGAYWLASTLALGLAGTNMIFTESGGAGAIGVVLSAPLAGVLVGLGVIAALLRAPRKTHLTSPIRMHGGAKGADPVDLELSIDSAGITLERDGSKERIALDTIESTAVDGEYLIVRHKSDPNPLELRPIGHEYRDREASAALVTALAERLRPQ